ncbi:MAG: alginate export family protein, partial [bacterium]|nr:alginate export family protein [bacterium]
MRAADALLVALVLLAAPVCAEEPSDAHLPSWLRLGMELRGRVESVTGLGFERGADDAYYLHRLRLNAAVEPTDWLRFAVEVQDSRAGARRTPVPGGVENTFDVRGASVELGRVGEPGWALRVGRQTLRYGNERLVGRADWGNVGRRFDAARLTYQSKRAKLDWFAATLAPSIRDGFDRFETDQRLFGFYAAFPELFAGAELQPFAFMKRAPGVDVVASGARVVGKLPAKFDYSGEAVFETGDVLGEDLRAWAGYAIIGRTVGGGKRAPRVYAEY